MVAVPFNLAGFRHVITRSIVVRGEDGVDEPGPQRQPQGAGAAGAVRAARRHPRVLTAGLPSSFAWAEVRRPQVGDCVDELSDGTKSLVRASGGVAAVLGVLRLEADGLGAGDFRWRRFPCARGGSVRESLRTRPVSTSQRAVWVVGLPGARIRRGTAVGSNASANMRCPAERGPIRYSSTATHPGES